VDQAQGLVAVQSEDGARLLGRGLDKPDPGGIGGKQETDA
jgi:hypothetical protein